MAEIRKRVRAVFFDLDETLLDEDRCMREAIARTCAALGTRYPQIEPRRLETNYINAAEELWKSYGSVPQTSDTGSTNGRDLRLEVWGKALTIHGLPGKDAATEAVDLYSQERRATYQLFPEVHEVLQTLHEKFILGLISNGSGDTQREKVEVTGVADYLHIVMVSGELGIGKPDSGIFLKALEAAQAIPEEAIHIGDSLAYDVAGARDTGIYAIWINRKRSTKPQNTPNPDLEINTLQALIPLLTP
jgi:putative hydrolase of the HAD superfamily